MSRQFKDLIRQPTRDSIRLLFFVIQWFVRFDSWLLFVGPFQCLVVSPVELTGFNCKRQL